MRLPWAVDKELPAVPVNDEHDCQLDMGLGGANIVTLREGSLTWVNIERPSDREKQYLSREYRFHDLDLDDCLSRIQRPKIDEYDDYVFVVLHFPVYNKRFRVTETSQVSIFIGPDYVVLLHKGDLKPLTQLFQMYQADEARRRADFSRGAAFLFYRIVDRLIDYCFPIISKVGYNIELAEERIFTSRRPGIVRDISILRRDIISLRRIIWPMRATVHGLEPKVCRYGEPDLENYFGDATDHLEKIWDALEEYKDIIEGLNDTYDSLASDRINDILRVLTILATIGTVLTVIASFFGMNVSLPGESRFTWLILLLVMLAVMGGMLFYFRRKSWL